MSEKKKIKINIDDRELTVNEGDSILQVSIDQGISVPHFCYHPGIGIDGNCRLCLVEVEGMPKLATSCNLFAKDGMVVRTKSEPVEKARNGVLEFFLLNHPLDCPFCDKGGECPLQNFTYDSGQNTTRYAFEKNHKPKHEIIGDHIILDKERCVLCSRCVRFGRDLAGHEELQITARGSKSEIFVPEEEKLSSKFTGNYADICPVGALTTREYRFKARPWELKTVNTLCGDCSLGCNVQAWKKDDQLLRLTPRVESEVNEWWLCDKGRFGIHRHHKEALVLTALKRTNQSFDKVATASALQEIIATLRANDSWKVGIMAHSSMTNEDIFILKQLANSIEGASLFAPISSNVHDIYKLLKTSDQEMNFPYDIENASSVMIIGESIDDAHPVLSIRLRRLVREKALNLVIANDQVSELDSIASEVVRASKWPSFFNELPEFLAKTPIQNILISDRIVSHVTQSDFLRLFDIARNASMKIGLLHSGSNDRGILDQWDGSMGSSDDFYNSAFDAVLYFGPLTAQAERRAKESTFFVQGALALSDVNEYAQYVLPLESSIEKSGTYTNHFGKVQTLRRARKWIDKGLRISETLRTLLNNFDSQGVTNKTAYEKIAAAQKNYPATMDDIPESTKTYHHYERATWR